MANSLEEKLLTLADQQKKLIELYEAEKKKNDELTSLVDGLMGDIEKALPEEPKEEEAAATPTPQGVQHGRPTIMAHGANPQ